MVVTSNCNKVRSSLGSVQSTSDDKSQQLKLPQGPRLSQSQWKGRQWRTALTVTGEGSMREQSRKV